uniref:Uncharacterized protein n=1 Tax=Oryza barthii TaxID=65489 RepID=A0A0D3FTG4_9ORYZ
MAARTALRCTRTQTGAGGGGEDGGMNGAAVRTAARTWPQARGLDLPLPRALVLLDAPPHPHRVPSPGPTHGGGSSIPRAGARAYSAACRSRGGTRGEASPSLLPRLFAPYAVASPVIVTRTARRRHLLSSPAHTACHRPLPVAFVALSPIHARHPRLRRDKLHRGGPGVAFSFDSLCDFVLLKAVVVDIRRE